MTTKRFGCIAILIALCATVVFAQSTPYSHPRFSATFNGPVSFKTSQNIQKTSTNNGWSSENDGVYQQLTIRDIDHNVEVSQASTDFYVNQIVPLAQVLEAPTNGTYQGHPWSFIHYNKDGETWHQWFIIVNANTVFVLSQLVNPGQDDSADWATFSKSLVIK